MLRFLPLQESMIVDGAFKTIIRLSSSNLMCDVVNLFFTLLMK